MNDKDKEFEIKQAQEDRLWQHGLHEDSVFNERQNYFFVAESMLFVAYSMLTNNQSQSMLLTKALASLGIVLTLLWIYVNRRQRYVLENIREKAKKLLPDYKETLQTRKRWFVSSLTIMTYIIPLLIGVVWLVFLVGAP